MDKNTHPYFVPNGESRQDTAVLLVGTADEYGIPQRDIATTRDGFRISQAIADALGMTDEESDVEVQEGQSDPRTSQGEVLTGQVQVQVPTADDDETTADDDDETVAYEDMDYADLKALASERGLETPDQKTATLIAALEADDAASDEG